MEDQIILKNYQRRLAAGALLGVSGAFIFAVTCWGWDWYLLEKAHSAFAWLKFVVGFIPCVLVCGLTGWLSVRMNQGAFRFILWVGTGGFLGWYASKVPYQVAGTVLKSLSPALADIINYPIPDGVGGRLFIALFTSAGLGAIAFIFFDGLVEGLTMGTAQFRKISSLLIWAVFFVIMGTSIDSIYNAALREPVQVMSESLDTAINQPEWLDDPNLAAKNHISALLPVKDMIQSPYKIFLIKYNKGLDTASLQVKFPKGVLQCEVGLGFISVCAE